MNSSNKTPANLPPPVWVDTAAGLASLLDALLAHPIVAVDTESDSLYSYFEKVCLVQFSTPGADYLLDPLAVDIAPLGQLFASETCQTVFHAAEYDILSLKRDYGFEFNNLFDTMLSARVLGWQRYGLASLLEEHFGVKLNKRFQRYNWGQRPLSQQALAYARLDTHYLLDLRQIEVAELTRRNRLREALAAAKRMTGVEPSPKEFDPNDFWRIKGARDLSGQQQAILRELFIVRDRIARKLDRPPFKVLNNSTLVRLARNQPTNARSLRNIKGVGANMVRYNGDQILQAIQQGRQKPHPRYKTNRRSRRPDSETISRYETLRHWRNQLAAERGIEPDVIMNNDTLMHIARRNPKTLKTLNKMLGDYQLEAYGPTLLKVLKEARG